MATEKSGESSGARAPEGRQELAEQLRERCRSEWSKRGWTGDADCRARNTPPCLLCRAADFLDGAALDASAGSGQPLENKG